MSASEISANSPLPVVVTNLPTGMTAPSPLPESFRIGSEWAVKIFPTPQQTTRIKIHQVHGVWIQCANAGSPGDLYWINLTAIVNASFTEVPTVS